MFLLRLETRARVYRPTAIAYCIVCQRAAASWAAGPARLSASQQPTSRGPAGAVPQVVDPNLLAGSPPEGPVFGK